MSDSFHYSTWVQEILFGAGSLDELAGIVARRGWKRAALITTHSQRANERIERIETLLGDVLVGVIDSVRQHVPQADVDAALALAQGQGADVLLALGGGSAIGVAKAVSHALHGTLPILAVPTTYAGSEMTPLYGVTRERDGVTKKETTSDPRILPRVVLYDPVLTLDLPGELTASTGINAFAHCIEAVYSIKRNPLSTLAATEGAQLIYEALPGCAKDGKNLEERTQMLKGAYLAGTSLSNVAMGLHHGVCHVLGGTANVPHGIANAIILPHAIRFNADACAGDLALIARRVGVPEHEEYAMAMDLALRVEELIERLNLPARLSEAGVSESDLPMLTALAFANKTVQNNPKKIENVSTLENFLRAAW